MPIAELPLTEVAPMLARSAPGVPTADHPGGPFDYEPKWDGFRAIVLAHDGEVEIRSRSGRSMTRYFPDVVAAVQAELPSRVVVDGEIVVIHDGRLDFELLGQRIHPAASRVRTMAQAAPAVLVVFDVLALAERSLLQTPLRERLAVLDSLALHGPRVHPTPRTTDAQVAIQWFERFEGAGLDGVVAKPLADAYQPGKRAMIKIKHARTADVVLAGYRLHKDSTPQRPLLGSLQLGLYEEGVLQFVGVAASFPMARRAELVAELADLVVHDGESHPWVDTPAPGGGQVGGGQVGGGPAVGGQQGVTSDGGTPAARRPGGESRWSSGKDLSFVPLRPERVLEVAYDHMEGDRFRHTTQFQRWRPDREPTSCTYDQLEEVVGYQIAELLPGAPDAGRGGTDASQRH